MKVLKNSLVLFLVSASAIVIQAQERNDVFDLKTKVTWLGLDFSQAKLLGDREKLGSESDIRNLIEAWNNLLIKEADKYNVAAAIDRKSVENAIEVTIEHNMELDVLAMYSDDKKDYLHVKPSDVEEIISSYDFKDLSGLGLMFNVESFSKLNGEGAIWITFINLETKEVLFTERLTGKPSGAGLRNYWAGAIHEVMEKTQKKEFEMWRKKYYRK